MKKSIYVLFLLPIVCVLICGCNKQTKKISISMNCNKEERVYEVKTGDVLNCTLLSKEYHFTVTDITDDSFKVELKDRESGLYTYESDYEWTVKKGEPTSIHTNTTDYQESVVFSWK